MPVAQRASSVWPASQNTLENIAMSLPLKESNPPGQMKLYCKSIKDYPHGSVLRQSNQRGKGHLTFLPPLFDIPCARESFVKMKSRVFIMTQAPWKRFNHLSECKHALWFSCKRKR